MVSRRRLAAIAWASGLQYFAAEVITARGWKDPKFDWQYNFISDLASTTIGENEGRVINSPRHAVMNAGFGTLGVLTPLGAFLFAPHIPDKKWRNRCLRLATYHGIGALGVAIVPTEPGVSEMRRDIHFASAAAAISGGNLLMLHAAAAMVRRRPFAAAVTATMGLVATGASFYSLFGPVTKPGISERLSTWPVTIWTAGTGIVVLFEDIVLARALEGHGEEFSLELHPDA